MLLCQTNLAKEIGALDVDAVASVKVLLCRAFQVLQDHDARARDQNVDFAELGNGLGNHGVDVCDAAGVALDEEGSVRTNLRGDGLGGSGVGGVVDCDVGAGLGEEEGGGGADAFAAAGDEGGLAGEGSGHFCCWMVDGLGIRSERC